MESDEREQRLAEAVAGFHDRYAQGETLDISGYCAAHPDLDPDLREALQALTLLDRFTDPPPEPEASAAEPLPERLSGHRILGEIGQGGMGRVLLAQDEGLNRKVAIKLLASRLCDNEQVRVRFLKEARAMAQLSHPHIARIFHLGPAGETPHFVMEYVEGAPLDEAARPLALEQKIELLRKVVLAVAFLHQRRMVHRDLKPANILVGADLEPKVLDFGLALELQEAGDRITLDGQVMGTPRYFSPEQARAPKSVDERTDVFSLGVILYELLTGAPPFRNTREVCEQDPAVPRRLNPSAPGALQNICLKALEKNPADRYASAREMAADLERFLAGEPVVASPSMYARLMSGRIDQHLQELESWRRDHVISDAEYDSLRRGYGRLTEREDAWIMEVRRLTFAQVSLYLGAWLLVIGAVLVILLRYTRLAGAGAVLVVAAVTAPAVAYGLLCWRQGQRRTGVAFLLAFCLLLPASMLVAMGEFGLLAQPSQGNPELELFTSSDAGKAVTNARMWWALVLSLPAYLWLRHHTQSSVFSLVFSVLGALFSLVTLLRMGMLEWLEKDPGKTYFHLIPIALLFFAAGLLIERRRHPDDSRYFYPIAFAFALVAFSGVVMFHKPYAEWLERNFPWTRGQQAYLFIVNAAVYAALGWICGRFPTPQLRSLAKAFRFVIPGHVLGSLLALGLNASSHEGKQFEARLFQVLLPVVASAFVYLSIPKQMKNFLASGLIFLAAGIFRLADEWLRDHALWPVTLLALGSVLMLAAANYSALRARWRRR